MQNEQEQVNYADLQTNDESLAEVVRNTREYIKKRQENLSFNSKFDEAEKSDVDEITNNIREWVRRTRKVIKG